MDQPEAAPPLPPGKPQKRWVLRIFLYGLLLFALAAVVVPSYMARRETACLNSCINNLRQIDGAKEQWSLEKKIPSGTPVVAAEVDQYIKGGAPKCPGGGVYTYNKVDEPPTCNLAGHTL